MSTITSLVGARLKPTAPVSSSSPSAEVSNGSFADALSNLVENSENSAADSNVAVGQMMDKSGDVHDAMIALQRAEMSLQLTIQVRNKLLQAYQEIMRMPV
jgi:flagellar hook-basal body complex protein FliE